MTYTVETPPLFVRKASKFFRKHPELRQQFLAVFRALEDDPFQPSLRLHPLSGKLKGRHAASLTHDYRITMTLLVSGQTITLIDIGTHDEVYR